MESWEMFQKLYAVKKLQGYTDDEIAYIEHIFGKLPEVLENYYRIAGKTKAFQCGQDQWMLPKHFQSRSWLRELDHLILLNENQGACRAGIRREDLKLPDPPVYVSLDDKEWQVCAPTTSEFLKAALAYEATFVFAYCPEDFFVLEEDEFEVLTSRLTKYPFEMKNWMGDITISLYANAEDNMVALLHCGDIQMLYGAASKGGYEKLLMAIEELGEPL